MQLRYNVATSLDGFIAPQDESTDWIIQDPTIDFVALYASFDAFVMGRKTYEVVTADPSFQPFKGRPKESIVVVSRSLTAHDHPSITVLATGVIDYIRALKKQTGQGIWLMGGGWLASECLEAGLLDAVDAAIMPVLLGSGYKLISARANRDGGSSELALRSVTKLDSGILMTQYDVIYGELADACVIPVSKKQAKEDTDSVPGAAATSAPPGY